MKIEEERKLIMAIRKRKTSLLGHKLSRNKLQRRIIEKKFTSRRGN